MALPDGSPLYQDSRQRSWADIEPQLCILHVIKEVHTLILDGVRAINNRLKRQGNKGRQKRRGRPSKTAPQQSQCRQGLSKTEQATFSWDPPSLSVRNQEDLSEQEKEDRALRCKIAPALKLFRPCNQQFYRLFARGISKPWARSRRRRLVNQTSYHVNAFRAKALKKISQDQLDNLIVFRGWANGERTNHHVERNNRGFRMMPKTRYKRRTVHTLEKALELELYARMLEHPSYPRNVRAVPILGQATAILQMAA